MNKANPDPQVQLQTSVEKSPEENLKGVDGWLMLFVAGTFLSIVLGLINLMSYGQAFSDIASVKDTIPGYQDAAMPLLWFEMSVNALFIIAAVATIFLILKRKKLARTIAILYLSSNVIFMAADYLWGVSVLQNFDLLQYAEAEMKSVSSDVGKSILSALIWVPYFIVSKRVKATLVN